MIRLLYCVVLHPGSHISYEQMSETIKIMFLILVFLISLCYSLLECFIPPYQILKTRYTNMYCALRVKAGKNGAIDSQDRTAVTI